MYDHDAAGLPVSDFNRHPVRQLIRDAAYYGARGRPIPAELDALKLSSEARAKVKRACEKVAEIHDEGHHQDAWSTGDRAAAEILGGLPDEKRDPDYLKPVAELPDDPAELAKLIPRDGSFGSPED
jgi:hypothetical protein